ncbi:hypothetical protein FHS89_001486 [Rubricella aquisinus]|uniref:DUF5642 domain-containing protein n=1 Tax=Rubricella aquisinus TaxID=2028108 RepID=A0A840WYL0_9RHOB|nr:hypothetical protein [Rubricella aquisinus]MBB5515474.1 hypothetical protein [Rubricella aquisinus]
MPISDRVMMSCRLGAVFLLLAVAACAPTAEQIARSNPYITDLTPTRVVFELGEREVAVGTPRGFCLDPSSIQATEAGATVVLGDCAKVAPDVTLADFPASFSPAPLYGDAAEIRAPVAALLTVSIAPNGLLEGIPDGDRLDVLERAVHQPEAGAVLARGVEAGPVRVRQTRQLGNALYVLGEEDRATTPAGASPRFWRAFTEENDRMVVLTISDYEPNYPGDFVLFRHLAALREAVRTTNAQLTN